MTTLKAGTTTLTATQTGNDSYSEFSREFTVTVTKADLTIKADNKAKYIGDENPTLTVTYTGFVNNDDASTLTTQPIITTTATTDSPEGTYPITVSGATSDNYNISYVSGTMTVATYYGVSAVSMDIEPGSTCDLVINFSIAEKYTAYQFNLYLPDGIEVVYDEEEEEYVFEPNNEVHNNQTVRVSKVDNNRYRVVAISFDKNLRTTSGELMRFSIRAASNFVTSEGRIEDIKFSPKSGTSLTFPNSNFKIYNRTVQTLNQTEIPSLTYGETYTLPASTNEGQPLTWTITDNTIASVNGNILTTLKAGSTTLTANQAGNDSYKEFSREFNLTVTKADLTITAFNIMKNVGEENPTLKVRYTGFVNEDDASALTTQPTIITAATTDSPIGTYPITVSGATSNKYNISYVSGTMTVTTNIGVKTVSMDVEPGSTSDLVINFSIAENYCAYQFNLYLPDGIEVVTDKNGKYMVELNNQVHNDHQCNIVWVNDHYSLIAISLNNENLRTTSGELLRIPIRATADYVTSEGRIEEIKFVPKSIKSTILPNSSFTLYRPRVQQSLNQTEIPSITYGEAYTLPASTNEGQTLTWTITDNTIASVSGNTLTSLKAGTTTLTATQAGNDNYSEFSREFTLTVTKVDLTITADNKTKNVGDENPTLTVTYTGFVNNDDASTLTTQPTITTTATTDSPMGTYPITVSGAVSNNYNISYVNGTMTVKHAEISDIANMDNAIYIEPLTGLVGDDVEIEVKLKNAEAATSYGFELVLAEGLTIDVNADGEFDDAVTLSSRHNKHVITTNRLSANTYKLGVASLSSKTLTDNDGLVLTITAHVSEDMTTGIYPIKIQNPLLVSADGTKPTIEATQTIITIADYTQGDVDNDGVIDLADAVLIINHYVGKPVPDSFVEKAAYVDADDVIDLADAVYVINYYVGKIDALPRRSMALKEKSTNDYLLFGAKGNNYALSLYNENSYLAFQCDIRVPEGCTLSDIRLSDSRAAYHTLVYNRLEDGRYRVAVLSMDNKTFFSNMGELLTFVTDGAGAGDVSVENIMFINSDMQKIMFTNLSAKTTGITDLEMSKNYTPLYDMQGRRINNSSNLRKGIYLFKGKKGIRK